MLSMMLSASAGGAASSPNPRKDERVGLLEDDAPSSSCCSERNPASAAVVQVGENYLFILRTLSVLTMLSGAAVIAVNLFLMIELKEPVRMYAVRSYNVVFGLLVVAAEVDRPEALLDYFRFLKCWPSKGLFIGFVGILTLDTEEGNDSMLQTATALLAMAVGSFYFVLGLLCLRARDEAASFDEEGGNKLVDEFVSLEENAPSWLDPSKDTSSPQSSSSSSSS